MTWLDHAGQQIGAAYSLVFNRAETPSHLDVSADGVMRSFGAVPLAALFAFGLFYSAFNVMSGDPDLARVTPLSAAGLPLFLVANAAGFLIVWAVSLSLVAALSERVSPVGAGAAIALYNWLQPPLFAVQFLPFGVAAAGGHVAYLQLLSLPSIAFLGFVMWRYIRTIFPVNMFGTVAIFVMFFLVDLATSALITAIALPFTS